MVVVVGPAWAWRLEVTFWGTAHGVATGCGNQRVRWEAEPREAGWREVGWWCRNGEMPAGGEKAEEYKGEVSNRFVVKIKEVSRSFAGKRGSLENTHIVRKYACCKLWHRDSKRHGTAVKIRTDFGGGQTNRPFGWNQNAHWREEEHHERRRTTAEGSEQKDQQRASETWKRSRRQEGIKAISCIKSAEKWRKTVTPKVKNERDETITSRRGIANVLGEFYSNLYEEERYKEE